MGTSGASWFPGRMLRRTAAVALVSLLGHALVLATAAPGGPWARAGELPALAVRGVAAVGAEADAIARADRLQRARRALVEAARADLRAGRLLLGRFLLRANQLDAEELGDGFDVEEAEARYAERLQGLRDALRQEDVRGAVPAVFGDLRYHGQPGGLMVDALLEGGGSCEQVAQLVAAAVHDAGRARSIALRFYGGVMADGASHLAPIAISGSAEHDLMSGRPAIRGGARIAAPDLVEIYARAHGLAPTLAAPGKGGPTAASGAADRANSPAPMDNGRPTLAAGFPPNDDRYPGALPLYVARAVKDPTDALEDPAEPLDVQQRARDCAYFVRMAVLRPPAIDIEPPAGGGLAPRSFPAEPSRIPDPGRLEREAALLHAAEALAAGSDADDADRLMGWACLAALGEVAAVDFTLAGERRLAAAALDKRRRAREEGKRALAAIRASEDARARVERRLSEEFGGRTWLLLALEGGDAAVLDLVERPRRDDWGRVSALTALVLWPDSRSRALALLARLPPQEQVEVMHEVFHAHDHMRPWASNVELDGEADAGGEGSGFRRAYGVFRGLAWRLWEGQRDLAEILDALRREAGAAGLDAAWEAALLDYCARNTLALYSQRPSGLEVAQALKAAVDRNGHPSLEGLRQTLGYITSRGRLDARTLADAQRMR